jgi:NADH:ubiquinone oxidoreductase subunit
MKNTIGTLIHTRLRGEFVGEDEFGNKYYRDKQARFGKGSLSSNEKRWVVYNGDAEATRVPPAWHAWLHHTVTAPPTDGGVPPKKPWEKPHEPNHTMTAEAYRPPGHTLRGGKRARGTGDYEPWIPS